MKTKRDKMKREKTLVPFPRMKNEQYELQTVHFLMTCGDKTGVSGMACANELGRSVGPAWGGGGQKVKQKRKLSKKEKNCQNCRNSITVKSYYIRKEI